ncbi:MAG TPA: cytochrome c nitrite reductase small subunit [Planctomycetota bacterium]|nr:cytochrome c nitrite reductase small subunit [Planctomycetota bacterium]OQC21266.1 MAG: Cytochrome c-type protein NrfH [Planctomycetes bacterium ADurb.Bin069]NMD36773.1 cytochrome c nitrite reductase small subunit [Planctomycetota bacterium]HNR99203.1 cytochrome c nitrite reductase small subunit [Planctomycetota bacterium]HNU25276.1 cytochrome c nitrite reductase small subunit [Planctomycetota bacterium]
MKPGARHRLLLLLAALCGVLGGLGAFTFGYAEGFSYLSDDPAVCANCHIMQGHFDSWRKGPHHAAAGCGDCHLPAGLFAKYLAKALNGYHHATGFTLQSPQPDLPGERKVFDEPIRIKPFNHRVLQENCLRCHGALVRELLRGAVSGADAVLCTQCHRGVGHEAQS